MGAANSTPILLKTKLHKPQLQLDLQKLHVNSRRQAVVRAQAFGLLRTTS